MFFFYCKTAVVELNKLFYSLNLKINTKNITIPNSYYKQTEIASK